MTTPATETKDTQETQSAPAPAPVVAPVQAPVAPSTPAAPVVLNTRQEPKTTDFESTVATLRTKGTHNEVALIDAFDRYVHSMQPKTPHTADTGLGMQRHLWAAITRVLNDTPAGEFSKLWNIAVGYFRQHKDTVFHIRYMARFVQYWPENQRSEMNGFLAAINLLKATAEDRKTVTKIVSLDKSLAEGFSDTARGRLLNFYSN